MKFPIGTRLLLRTNGDYGYDGDLDACVITLHPEFRTWAGTLKHAWWAAYNVLPEVPGAHHMQELVVWDNEPAFISRDDGDLEQLFMALDDNDQVEFGENDKEPETAQETEAEEVHVTYQGLYWSARPRHSDVAVETTLVTWESLGFSKPEIKS